VVAGGGPQEAVRLAAVQWAVRLFPASHVPARWVCVLGAGDTRQV
jgi:proteasome component ECM29